MLHQLWDVCGDQEAVDLVREIKDPQEASQVLLDHALQAFSVRPAVPAPAKKSRLTADVSPPPVQTDNLSVLVVTLRPAA